MTQIAIHHLPDWAVSRHLLSALRAAGVAEEALGCAHYFYPGEVADPFASLPESDGFPDAEDALMATSAALDALGHALVDMEEDDERTFGFHWSASDEQLAAAAKEAEAHGRDCARLRTRERRCGGRGARRPPHRRPA
jgi:hypothetical protein